MFLMQTASMDLGTQVYKSIMKNMGFEVKQTYIQITVQSLAGCVFRPVTNLLEFVPLAVRWDLFDHQKRYSSSTEVLGTK